MLLWHISLDTGVTMGEAKRRGTREERMASAVPKERKPDREYKQMLPYTNSALNYLWSNFKVFGDTTIGEVRAQAIKAQAEARAASEV
jgi:hypothetical protein